VKNGEQGLRGKIIVVFVHQPFIDLSLAQRVPLCPVVTGFYLADFLGAGQPFLQQRQQLVVDGIYVFSDSDQLILLFQGHAVLLYFASYLWNPLTLSSPTWGEGTTSISF
jgi:hypothetical protein